MPTHIQEETAPTNFRARYGEDIVLRFNISNDEEIKALAEAADTLYLDVWESTDFWADIRMAKDIVSFPQVPSLLGLLPQSLQTSHTPLMHDLAQVIYESYPSGSPMHPDSHLQHSGFTPSLRAPNEPSSVSKDLFFTDYQPYSVIQPWMRLMASMFTTHTRLINIGMSYDGRDIKALRVGVHPTNSEQPTKPRKTILIAGGSHAREWISTSTVNYIASSMITRYGKSQAVTKLIEEFDWVFIPTINPDGYVHTWDSDRLWRKNRQETEFRFCRGLDLDRSFGFQWDGESTISNPCSESYAGKIPFEALEAKRLADWARNETENNNVNFVAFLDLHSYSQQVLYPYSYSCASTPPSLENLEELALNLRKAIYLTSGRSYSVSPACGTPYRSISAQSSAYAKMELGGGSALDWFYHELGVKYAYQLKLRDTGTYGFLLPKSAIVPTGKEMFNAVLGLGRFLMGNKGIELDWEKEAMIGDERVSASFARDQVRFWQGKAEAEQVEPEVESETSSRASDVDEEDFSAQTPIPRFDLRRRR
ncbi:MAG: hypothetical protein Q9227_008722 [Pyrenula ochraceoflavens]